MGKKILDKWRKILSGKPCNGCTDSPQFKKWDAERRRKIEDAKRKQSERNRWLEKGS